MAWGDSVTARKVLKVPTFSEDLGSLLTDAVKGIPAIAASPSDSFVPSDNLSALFKYRALPTDSLSLADNISPLFKHFGLLSESGTLSDSLLARFNYLVSISDSFSSSDTVTAVAGVGVSVSDSFAPSDTVSALLRFLAGISDALALADNASPLMRQFGSLSDATGLSDNVVARLNLLAAISCDVASALADLVTYSKPVTGGDFQVLSYSFSDQVNPSDALTALEKYLANPSDPAQFDDAVNALFKFRGALAESFAPSDNLVLNSPLSYGMSDSVGFSDIARAVAAVGINVGESASPDDLVAALFKYHVECGNFNDSAAPTDAVRDLLKRVVLFSDNRHVMGGPIVPGIRLRSKDLEAIYKSMERDGINDKARSGRGLAAMIRRWTRFEN